MDKLYIIIEEIYIPTNTHSYRCTHRVFIIWDMPAKLLLGMLVMALLLRSLHGHHMSWRLWIDKL